MDDGFEQSKKIDILQYSHFYPTINSLLHLQQLYYTYTIFLYIFLDFKLSGIYNFSLWQNLSHHLIIQGLQILNLQTPH